MTPDEEFEQRRAAERAMSTHPHECVLCYVDRMLRAFGCDGTLRWTVRWRLRRAPRAVGLEHRLTARGGYCDCELFSNGWQLARELRGEAATPPCARARVATEPCANWVGCPPDPW